MLKARQRFKCLTVKALFQLAYWLIFPLFHSLLLLLSAFLSFQYAKLLSELLNMPNNSNLQIEQIYRKLAYTCVLRVCVSVCACDFSLLFQLLMGDKEIWQQQAKLLPKPRLCRTAHLPFPLPACLPSSVLLCPVPPTANRAADILEITSLKPCQENRSFRVRVCWC